METIVYNEIIDGKTAVVKEMNMPFGHYYTGYIEILSTDPISWKNRLEMGKEIFFDSYAEFEEFPSGVTFAGTLPGIDSEKQFVGFDTESFPGGEYDKEDCIDILKETGTRLAIRTRAAQEAIASQKVENQGTKTDKKPKNVGLLLDTVNDIANAVAFNKNDETDKVNQTLENASLKLIAFLDKELNVSPEDVAMFAILKTVLGEDEDDEDE